MAIDIACLVQLLGINLMIKSGRTLETGKCDKQYLQVDVGSALSV